ncbi:MAG: protein-glutamate O-methyltransferase CheR [Spirochaetaceae bacterium]|jgi:chemotaxis protein methyltransferase CheR|nr:protein-glutamate O-methyltransferase CheR [Spirochaetaceae bacterium]
MPDVSFFSDADFECYKKLIYKESGIVFTANNRSILEGRLRERLRQQKSVSVGDYFKAISADADELKRFLDAITTNLTSFFRNLPHFSALEKFVLPEIIAAKRPGSEPCLHIWSAGCSTGEEPYSIAMLLNEKLPAPWKFDIVASDLSLKCLMTAKEGFYAADRIVGIPDAYLEKYFDKLENGYKVKDSIKSKVRFDYHNLINLSTWRNFDVVFCRNVLIYFDEAVQTQVVNHFWNSMANKAFLYIGHSESLFAMNTKFEFVKTQWATLYKKWVA